MCSIGEDDFGDDGGVHAMQPSAPPEVTNEVSGGDVCSKCGAELHAAIYKLSCRSPECRDCFLSYARHKFRAALGSSKILPRGAQVLLCIDGSAESLVLLDMLHFAQTQNNFKRLHCSVRVLCIDERVLQEQSDQFECPDELLQLQSKYAPFEFYTLPVSTEAPNVPGALQRISAQSVRTDPAADFVHKLTTLRSLTARQDFLQQCRRRLMGLAAQQLACDYVFVPSISTTLATQLLSAIALGRGGSAALDVSLLDDRLVAGVKLVRPLKDLNEAEVQLYLRAQQLQPLVATAAAAYGMERGANASLQNLTQAFVTNLQQNYASTVSTVFRTGDKIAPNRQLSDSFGELQLEHVAADNDDVLATTGVCAFCLSPLDCIDSRTLLATAFSSVVSESGATLDECTTQLEERARSRQHATADKRLRRLCHACRNIQTDFRNTECDLV